jgi:hypothetical protein
MRPYPPALGYAHPGYAQSLAQFGTPVELPRSGGWILERPVPGSAHRDAMGSYPLLFCRSWAELHADLRELEGRLVSLAAVPDPFGDFDLDLLRECFGDVVVPFKEHFVTDMHRPLAESVSRHHRKYARKALQIVQVDVVQDPPGFLDEWIELHRTLTARHDLKGLRAFSRSAFSEQLRLPGIVVIRARHEETTVGAQLWFQHEEVAYGHVLAFSQLGYDTGAPYALYWSALEHFAGKVRWCWTGGVAGTDVQAPGGLGQFKRGWATTTRTAYFCGRILDRDRYDELARIQGRAPGGFFPAYRTSME